MRIAFVVVLLGFLAAPAFADDCGPSRYRRSYKFVRRHRGVHSNRYSHHRYSHHRYSHYRQGCRAYVYPRSRYYASGYRYGSRHYGSYYYGSYPRYVSYRYRYGYRGYVRPYVRPLSLAPFVTRYATVLTLDDPVFDGTAAAGASPDPATSGSDAGSYDGVPHARAERVGSRFLTDT